MAPNPVVYRPNQRFRTSFLRSFLATMASVFSEKELLQYLIRREIVGPYKRSFLGSFWFLISPLAAMLSWVILQFGQILTPGETSVPYPVYVLSGTLVWTFFMRTTNSVGRMLRSAQYVLTHLRFPHEILPAVHIGVSLCHFGVSLLLALPVMILFGVIPHPSILLLPLALLPLLMFATALGLVASVLSAISFDLSQIITTSLGILMFFTPVIYTPEAVRNPALSALIELNPLTYLVALPRAMIVPVGLPPLVPYLCSSVLALVLLLFCWRAFHLTEHRLIERLI